MDELIRMMQDYIGAGLRGKAAPVSLDAIRDRAAQLVAQGVPRADIDAARAAADEAAKAAYNDELRRAVDSVLNAWGTVNSKGSGQRVIRDQNNLADSVPENPQGTDEERLQWALQVLKGYSQANIYFSKRAFGSWESLVTPLTTIYAPAAEIYPEWVPDYYTIDPESGTTWLGGPVDYGRWVDIAGKLGFQGIAYEQDPEYGGVSYTSQFIQFVDEKRAQGFDFVAHRTNRHYYNNRFGFKLPNGEVVGQMRTGDDDDIVDFVRSFVLPVFSIAGGFAFLGGQIAGFTGIPSQYATGFLRAAVATGAGQDVDRALLSALGPVVAKDILPPTVFQAPDVGAIDPGLLEQPSMDDFYIGDEYVFLPESDFTLPVETDFVGDFVVPDMEVFPIVIDDGWESWEPGVTDPAPGAISDGTIIPPPLADGLPDTIPVEIDAGWMPPYSEVGTGGIIDAGPSILPAVLPVTGGTGPDWSPAQIVREVTQAALDALKVVAAWRALNNPPPNRVTQARVGNTTVRANPDGTISRTGADGRVTRSKPPVGQPQVTTDGSLIVNNGDGTYTSISPQGASVVNRYPLEVSQTFGGMGNLALPLLIGGGALALLAATRRRSA